MVDVTSMIRALALAIVIAAGTASQAPDGRQDTVVAFETEKGTIEFEVQHPRPGHGRQLPPLCRRRILRRRHVNRAIRPDNTVRHDVEIQVIQFQIDEARSRQEYQPIPLERTSVTGLKHVDGTISMARGGPDTATGSFSIVIGDQPEMDFGGRRNPDGQGFAAFGRVVRGVDVVKAIHASPTGKAGPYGTESLSPPIKILRVPTKARSLTRRARSARNRRNRRLGKREIAKNRLLYTIGARHGAVQELHRQVQSHPP